eukprot:3308585-Prymnesium_polylepis.1
MHESLRFGLHAQCATPVMVDVVENGMESCCGGEGLALLLAKLAELVLQVLTYSSSWSWSVHGTASPVASSVPIMRPSTLPPPCRLLSALSCCRSSRLEPEIRAPCLPIGAIVPSRRTVAPPCARWRLSVASARPRIHNCHSGQGALKCGGSRRRLVSSTPRRRRWRCRVVSSQELVECSIACHVRRTVSAGPSRMSLRPLCWGCTCCLGAALPS